MTTTNFQWRGQLSWLGVILGSLVYETLDTVDYTRMNSNRCWLFMSWWTKKEPLWGSLGLSLSHPVESSRSNLAWSLLPHAFPALALVSRPLACPFVPQKRVNLSGTWRSPHQKDSSANTPWPLLIKSHDGWKKKDGHSMVRDQWHPIHCRKKIRRVLPNLVQRHFQCDKEYTFKSLLFGCHDWLALTIDSTSLIMTTLKEPFQATAQLLSRSWLRATEIDHLWDQRHHQVDEQSSP